MLVHPAGSANDKLKPMKLKILFGQAIHGRTYVKNVLKVEIDPLSVCGVLFHPRTQLIDASIESCAGDPLSQSYFPLSSTYSPTVSLTYILGFGALPPWSNGPRIHRGSSEHSPRGIASQ